MAALHRSIPSLRTLALLFVSFRVALASNDTLGAVCPVAGDLRTIHSTCALSPGLHSPSGHGDGADQGTRIWEVRLSPGKGRGVFALQHIRRGTTILVEEPLVDVRLPALVPGRGYDLGAMAQDVARQYARLTPEDKVEFDACHEHRFEGDRRDEAGRLMAILRSNAYTTEDAEGRGKVALYPKAALINHSCQPNVLNGDASGTRKIVATRDILEGEEILTTYIPLLMDTASRQQRLAQYGFVCTCSACRTGSSDQQRVRAGNKLSELEEALARPTSTEEAAQLLDEAQELDSYFVTQGFSDYLVKTSRLAYEYATRAHNTTTARKWAKKRLEYT